MKFGNRFERKRVLTPVDSSKNLVLTDFKRESDINHIVNQYVTTGTLPTIRGNAFKKRFPQFGDFTNCTDFQSIQFTLKESESAFMTLSSRIRERFNNDPAKLIEFLSDSKNREEAEELGLIEKMKPILVDLAVKPTEPTSPVKGAEGEAGTAQNEPKN